MKKSISLRLACIFLTVLLILPALSCSEKSGNDTGDTANAVTEPETEADLYPDDLSDTVHFDGSTIRFISSTERVSIALNEEDDTGDVINAAVWERNTLFAERLGLEIELAQVTGYDKFNSVVGVSINAASDDYDVFCGHTRFNISLAANGYLKNLSNVEFLNFEKPYWSQLYIDNISYKDAMFWATGDLTMNFIAYIYAMFVNSSLWNDYYGAVDIYDIVLNGQWTLDKLNEYSSVAYRDINGNSKEDDEDSYGVVMQKGHVLNGMVFASGVEYTSVDENDDYYVSLDNPHTIDVFDRLHALFYNNQYARMLENSAFDGTAPKMFTENRLLFCPNTFGFCQSDALRQMKEDFYVIPLPKFDEKQDSYRVNQYDGVPIYGIPVTVPADKVNMIGAALEALASMSYTIVTPVYYDVALKNKYSRDEKTAEMLDLIHDHVTADFSFAWGDTVGSVMNVFYDNIQKTSITSTLASLGKGWPTKMEKLCAKLEEYKGN